MGDYKESIDQLNKLSIQALTPRPITSPHFPTPSRKQHEISSRSNIDIIIAELLNRRRGQTQEDSEWWCARLGLDELESLEARIQADEDLDDFVRREIKYDYFPRFSQFVLRMALDLHEYIIGKMEEKIWKQLFLLGESDDQPSTDFARKVISTRSHEITLPDRERHIPDGSFSHANTSVPGVILEVSHSQKRRDLPFLADDYMLGSNGTIQVVIGIDLEYRKRKGVEGKVFVWRPRFVKDGITELEASQTFEGIFRAHDGSLVNGDKALRIQLKDFGNQYACPGINDISGEIVILFSELYEMAQGGDKRAEMVRHKREIDEASSNMRKRQRIRPPPEELHHEDEERFQEQEEEVQRRLSEQDGY